MSLTAKQRENIARRTKIQQNQETIELLMDDALNNMISALKKEGTTGHLSESDGIERIKPYEYRGFFCEIFGLPVSDSKAYVGLAKRKHPKGGIIGGRQESFETYPEATEHECGKVIKMTIDALDGVEYLEGKK